MKRLTLFVLAVAAFPLFGHATHLVGASLTYEHLGGASYKIKLKLYRDCNGIAFPGTVNIQVRRQDNTALPTISIPFPGSITLNPPLDTCAVNPGICVQEAVYTKVVNNLPPVSGGYHLWWQSCCRNCSIDNLPNCNQGFTSYTKIPDNTLLLTNSSPEWVTFPPIFVCANQPLVFDHSATDIDGDSLVYRMYWPDDDGGYTVGYPFFTFQKVTWSPGYWEQSPLEPNISPTCFVGINSGILTTTPTQLGQYVLGVVCEEYRNDTIINRIVRDFQFNVVNCPPPVLAGIGPATVCNGNSITFTNTSDSLANGFFWDFGDLTTTTDTSSQFEPSYTYPDTGCYLVTLIAQQGTPCADTAYQTICVSWVNADFTSADSACVGTSINFTNLSTSSNNSNINSWFWDFGDAGTSALPNPSHTYASGGLYTVTLIVGSDKGCYDTIQKTVWIQDLPLANAGNDTVACTNNPTVTLSGSVQNAAGGQWIGAGSFNPNPFTLNADYTPTAAEIANGFAILILTTTGNGLCPSATDTIIITFVPGPTVQAGPDHIVCKDTSGIDLSGFIAIATGGTWSTSGDGTFLPDPDSLNVTYIPGSGDTANGSVMIILTSTGNGNCLPNSDTIMIFFTNLPVVQVSAPDTACENAWIPITANSSTGSGIWTSNGNGTFVNDTSLTTTYVAAGDSGSVTLIFTSSNNGGCQPVKDSITIALIPAPVAAFTSTEACENDLTLFIDASTTIGFISGWSWDFGDATGDTVQNPSHTYPAAGTYMTTLIVTSNNGCVDTIQQQVIVHYLPSADFAFTDVCLNEVTSFFDSSTVANASIVNWAWNFGDGNGSTDMDPTHFYGNTGTFPVQLIVTSDKGCKDTVVQNLNILPLPTAGFTVDESPANVFDLIDFLDQSGNVTGWWWAFGDGGVDSVKNPSHSYTEPGTYTVMLVVTDANGCIDTVYQDVIIFLPPKVPSGFTPNGDGQNDFLFVKGGPYKQLEFKIYNNWGELIWVGNNQANGWDGKRENKEQPVGVYVYTVVAVTEDGEEHKISGDVTLLR